MQESKWRIPAELAALPQWVCWGAKGKARKCPYNPRTGYPAKAGQPDTWADLATAAKAVNAGRYEGVGFEFNGGGIVGVDFDHCIEGGQLDAWAAAWVQRFDSYTELSPSGTGLHIICKGKLPGEAVKRPRAELYDRGRYFTVTGQPWGGPAKPLRDAQEAVNALYAELQAETRKAPDRPTAQRTAPALAQAGKDYVSIGLQRDGIFRALWEGERPNGNESADDMALLNKLAFWCSCDAEQMQAAFLASPHAAGKDEEHKKKLERDDYLPRSIDRAVKDCPETAAGRDSAYQLDRARRDFAPKDGDVFGRSMPQDVKGKEGPLLVPMAKVEARQASYLISPYLPRGMLAIMGGISGVGKTFLVLSWAAAVSNGRRLPFQKYFEPAPPAGYVYYFTQENDPNIVIRPRLDLLGANMEKVLIQAPSGAAYEPLTLNDPRLEEAAKEYPPALVIFDPIQSYLGAGVEMNKANEVRPILDGLGDFAKRHNCTVVLVSHMSKPGMGNTSALDRLLGSSDFRNAARSIIVVGRDPEDKDSRVFAHGKNSIGEPGTSQRYHIDGRQGVIYDGECDLTADDIVKQAQPGARAKPALTLTTTRKMLEELLGPEGCATLEQVETLQAAAGISQRTLYEARREMALQSVSLGQPPRRQTWWLLPEIDAAKFKEAHKELPEQLRLS